MSDPLARVKRASEAKRRAEHEYRSALEAGREAGLSFADMAKAAGVSRQAARQMLAKRPVTDEAAMTERLTELDARWDALVAAIAETFMPADPRAEQAIRNGTNAKAKRTLAGVNRNGKASGSIGRHRVILPTVRQEARNIAEAKIRTPRPAYRRGARRSLRAPSEAYGAPRYQGVRLARLT
jgi:hypothetical protein